MSILRKRNAALASAVLLASALFCGCRYGSAKTVQHEEPVRVLLVGWDGVSSDTLRSIMQQDSMPHLRELASRGSIQSIHITEDTATLAGWPQILTGYRADVTGAYTNNRSLPLPEGSSIFSKLHKHFGEHRDVSSDGVYTFMVASKSVFAASPFTARPRMLFSREGKYTDYFVGDRHLWHRNVLRHAERELRRYARYHRNEPLFAFVHFEDPDQAGHTFGSGSRQYRMAIESCDTFTGYLMNLLKKLGLGNTRVYVTSDHGFDRTDARYFPRSSAGDHAHDMAPYTFLATNNPSPMRAGNRMDIGPTLLEEFGIKENTLPPGENGISLTVPARMKRGATPLDLARRRRKGSILLISWSGANRETVRKMLQRGELPWLERLISRGGLFDIDITTSRGRHTLPPSADPVMGMSVLLTGLEPDATGVFDASRVEAPVPRNWSLTSLVKGPARSGQAEGSSQQLLTALLVGRDSTSCRHSLPGTSKNNVAWALDDIAKGADLREMFVPSHQIKNEAIKLLHGPKNVFAFLHFTDPDIAAHKFGEGSSEYIEAIRACDRYLGDIVKYGHGRLGGPPWIYVTSASGFERHRPPVSSRIEPKDIRPPQGHDHFLGSYSFLATNDPWVRRSGLQRDIAPTLLDRAGVKRPASCPPLRGHSLMRPAPSWTDDIPSDNT